MLVWAYCKDPGGTAGMVPVVRELRARGVRVRLFPEGVAQKICVSEGLYCEVVSLPQLALHEELPKLLLTSMCSGGGLGRDLIEHMRPRGVWCVALQDFWGARLATDWADPKCRPHDIVVNDAVGADIVARAWDDRVGIIENGYPALDRFAGLDPGAEKKRLRELHGIAGDAYVVLFGGQVKGTSAVLEETVAAVQQVGDCLFVPRRHPRLATDSPDDARRWDEIMAKIPDSMLVPRLDALKTEDVLMMADVVCAAFSTILVEASVLRKSAIAVLMPQTGMAGFLAQTGGIMDEHPLVSLGCVSKATNPGDLHAALTVARTGHPRRILQERAFTVDGKNASRLVDILMTQMAR